MRRSMSRVPAVAIVEPRGLASLPRAREGAGAFWRTRAIGGASGATLCIRHSQVKDPGW